MLLSLRSVSDPEFVGLVKSVFRKSATLRWRILTKKLTGESADNFLFSKDFSFLLCLENISLCYLTKLTYLNQFHVLGDYVKLFKIYLFWVVASYFFWTKSFSNYRYLDWIYKFPRYLIGTQRRHKWLSSVIQKMCT